MYLHYIVLVVNFSHFALVFNIQLHRKEENLAYIHMLPYRTD